MLVLVTRGQDVRIAGARRRILKSLAISFFFLFFVVSGCSFLSKAKNAEEAGAVGVLIADNDANNDRVMVNMITDGTKREVNIPAGFMLAKDR